MGETALHHVAAVGGGWGLLISATLTILHAFSVLDVITKVMWLLNGQLIRDLLWMMDLLQMAVYG